MYSHSLIVSIFGEKITFFISEIACHWNFYNNTGFRKCDLRVIVGHRYAMSPLDCVYSWPAESACTVGNYVPYWAVFFYYREMTACHVMFSMAGSNQKYFQLHFSDDCLIKNRKMHEQQGYSLQNQWPGWAKTLSPQFMITMIQQLHQLIFYLGKVYIFEDAPQFSMQRGGTGQSSPKQMSIITYNQKSVLALK